MPRTQEVQGETRDDMRRERWLALFTVLAVLGTLVVGILRPAGASTEPASTVDVITEPDTAPVELGELSADVFSGVELDVDGSGIDVAVIDTGVAHVDGLGMNKVLYGPDMSGEVATNAANVDTYGHGTHMAGIIAGDREGHEGVAPGARIVSVKVAGADGETSLPQMVAAIDWVIANKDVDGLNIRVLNLAFGHADVAAHLGDPLSAAVERAWHAGIFVVVAAGNTGDDHHHLGSPAIDPYVLAVGSSDSTGGESRDLQPVGDWSSHGNAYRSADLVAPGRSIASYRVPGSTIDEESPIGRHGDDLFRGTGTSQSAAVVSGVAARLLEAHPDLTPDQLKATLVNTAGTSLDLDPLVAGAGVLNAAAAFENPAVDAAPQNHTPALTNGAPIAIWTQGTWDGATWYGGTWAGGTWAGGTWAGGTWAGGTWAGSGWQGSGWQGS
ncbi:MAG: S8 family serine peptidase, partial [Acidimicrobiales bacterium]